MWYIVLVLRWVLGDGWFYLSSNRFVWNREGFRSEWMQYLTAHPCYTQVRILLLRIRLTPLPRRHIVPSKIVEKINQGFLVWVNAVVDRWHWFCRREAAARLSRGQWHIKWLGRGPSFHIPEQPIWELKKAHEFTLSDGRADQLKCRRSRRVWNRSNAGSGEARLRDPPPEHSRASPENPDQWAHEEIARPSSQHG